MKFHKLIIIFISMVFMAKAWGGEPLPLVYVFCDYVLSKNPSTEGLDDNWSELVRHFESRVPYTQGVNIPESPKFQKCMEKYSPLFEMGEFILDGRKAAENTLNQIKENSKRPALLSAVLPIEERELSTPEFSFALPLETASAPSSEVMEKDTLDRIAEYKTRWFSYVEDLHVKVRQFN